MKNDLKYFLLYLPPECGVTLVSSRIVGGQNAKPGLWPWQVSFRSNGRHFCGGSLITNRWIVSAAHCFQNIPTSLVTVYLGSYNLTDPNPNEVSLSVNHIIIYPNYTADGGDISLVELSSNVIYTNYILPVCLPAPTVIFPTGLKCWVTGWGDIQYNVNLPNPKTLQEVVVPLIDAQRCTDYYHTPNSAGTSGTNIQSDMICAGYLDGGKDSCQGDSGGPLVCAADDHWFLAGVVSFGEGCGEPYRPGVYTLLTTYSDWIQSHVPEVSVNVRNVTFSGPYISLYQKNTANAGMNYVREATLCLVIHLLAHWVINL
ncbi:hypothetical protein GDO86_019327 [Hymenochirus boettgeri]|uniref:Peptidase S1 domain-containing protein n=1 Tax=Hymenochirus boettgeri TaxID=247094 RepID=A0A8T2ILY4_9PIPI|nr:hypothetical protein GDO86_019327 [Hymenochirus boettgeri]